MKAIMTHVEPTSVRSILRRCGLVLGFCLFIPLGACFEATNVSAEAFVERAKAHRAKGDLQASIIELKNALQKEPQNAAARLLLGQVYVELGDVAGGEKELLKARNLGVALEDLVVPLGRAMLRRGKYDQILNDFQITEEFSISLQTAILVVRGQAQLGVSDLLAAEASFQRTLTQDPNAVGALVGLARIALRNRDHSKAESLFKDASEAAPDDPDVLKLKGDVHFARKQFTEAEKAYAELVNARPHDRAHVILLAFAQIGSGKTDEAIGRLDTVLKSAPGHPIANYLRALAAFETRDFKTAKLHSERVLAVDQYHLMSQLIAGAASYAMNQDEQAYRYLAGYLAEVPTHDPARRMLGATLLRLGSAEEALATLEPLVDQSVDDAQLLDMIGNASVQIGDLQSAKLYFERVAAAQPNSAEARTKLGQVQMALGETVQGIEELEKALEQDPDLDRTLVALAFAHLRAGEFDKALEIANRVRVNNPDSPLGPNIKGVAYAGKGLTEEARAAFAEALERDPGNSDASGNLAALAFREGKIDEARALLRVALEHNPNDLRTLLPLADLEIGSGDSEAARAWLEKAIGVHPDAARPRQILGQLYLEGGDPLRALEITQIFLLYHPDEQAVREIVARAQLSAGRPADAVSTLRTLVEALPESGEAHYLLGLAYRNVRDWTRTRQYIERALEIDPNHISAKVVQADVLMLEGDLDSAEKLAADLKDAHPEVPEVWELDGTIALRRNRVSNAIESFQTAMNLQPLSARAIKLALAQQQANDVDGSRQTLESWLEKSPNDTNARSILGVLYINENRLEAARDNYLSVISVAPNNVTARNNLAYSLLKLGAADEALVHAKRAHQLAGDNPGVMDTLGVVLLELGRVQEAIPLLEAASRQLSDSRQTRFHLAQGQARHGNMDIARDILRKLLAEDGPFEGRTEAETLLKELEY